MANVYYTSQSQMPPSLLIIPPSPRIFPTDASNYNHCYSLPSTPPPPSRYLLPPTTELPPPPSTSSLAFDPPWSKPSYLHALSDLHTTLTAELRLPSPILPVSHINGLITLVDHLIEVYPRRVTRRSLEGVGKECWEILEEVMQVFEEENEQEKQAEVAKEEQQLVRRDDQNQNQNQNYNYHYVVERRTLPSMGHTRFTTSRSASRPIYSPTSIPPTPITLTTPTSATTMTYDKKATYSYQTRDRERYVPRSNSSSRKSRNWFSSLALRQATY